MLKRKSYIEIILMGEPIRESDGLQEIIEAARILGFSPTELRIDPVIKRNEPWKSTQESTEKMPVIYLRKDDGPEALIINGPEDEKYRIFNYRIMG